MSAAEAALAATDQQDADSGKYKWVALSNTTLSMMMATIDTSIVIIAMPAIFRGIHLDPTDPGNISYLLWMIIGYLLVTAVLVVTLGRLGDMFGRVRIYNLGFVVFTLASIALSLDPLTGPAGALWLILWRLVQAFGGAMLMANAAAILTDAFRQAARDGAGHQPDLRYLGAVHRPRARRVLAAWNWRAVFWVNVPISIFGTIWSYLKLREIAICQEGVCRLVGQHHLRGRRRAAARLDHLRHPALWRPADRLDQPAGARRAGLRGRPARDLLPDRDEDRRADVPTRVVQDPRLRRGKPGEPDELGRPRRPSVHAHHLAAGDLPAPARLHYSQTPLRAGIYLLPLTAGFLIAGPVSGYLSDRYGPRPFSTTGLLVSAAAFAGLLLLPVVFPYWLFALVILCNGLGSGLFASPNTSAIMSSVPARYRGAASGMRSTFQNSGMSLSIGIFFSLMIAGLAATLPRTLSAGLRAHGVPAPLAAHVANLPPVSTLFASFLGYNPIGSLLRPTGVLARLPRHDAAVLTSKEYFPHLISGPFHHGLVIVFSVAIAMSLVGAVVSLLRGGQFYYDSPEAAAQSSLARRPLAPARALRLNGRRSVREKEPADVGSSGAPI